MQYNELLQSQIDKHLPQSLHATNELKAFLEAINNTYEEHMKNHLLLKQSMEKALVKMKQNTKQIKKVEHQRRVAIVNLKNSLVALENNNKNLKIEEKDDLVLIAKLVWQHIEKRKKIENRLKIQNEELKKINTELDKFVYSASHDLRAPLASIKGLISIVKLEKEESKKLKCLNLVNKNINKLDNFIQDIINYSRNARLEVKREKIDFEILIKEIFSGLKFMPNAEFIEKTVQVQQDCPFYSDENRLNIIFNNLISNAVRYCDTEKKSLHVNVNIKINKEKAIVIIEDNGQGIEPEHIERIFDMFFRASQQSVGSGLGLYIVKESINVLKGSIQVKSKLGKFTKFIIEIPNITENNH